MTTAISTNSDLFVLDDAFIKKFKNKQPKWGPVGYLTYKRTYARRLPNGTFEEFWQTARRVVEGTYRIQHNHCKALKLPWNDSKAQKSAQEMYTRVWQFKFLPPGRGLWMMGTEYIDKIGSAALNNCGFASTEDLKTSFSAPFCFLMDMSMLGVGVGGDTRGAGTVTIKKPFKDSKAWVISDDREGWVNAVRVKLDAYVRETTMPESYDFSLIRPAGSPINGFGGTSSGPDPLRELLESIDKILIPLIGKKITSTAIVDIFNIIGKCVVAGNVRRSAEIMFGEVEDTEFLSLKDPEKHAAELESHRWASNNSIFAKVGMDYSKVVESTIKNGEPGYFWLENARQFSRMNGVSDWKDENAKGGNPCQPAWATVLTPGGIRTFADIQAGSIIWSGKQWTIVTKKWVTGTKPVFSYRTSAGEFIGTEQHRIVSEGTKVEVQHAESIDIATGKLINPSTAFNRQTIVDGLVLGDGSVKSQAGHKDYISLHIGKDDEDYFHNEIKEFIGSQFDGTAYNIKTSLVSSEIPYTYVRKIPDRYLYGNELTLRSFLRGLYSANGSVVDKRITLKTASPAIRDGVQQMLSALGIQSYFTTNKETNVEFKNGEYTCKESYDVNITAGRNLFFEYIGFIQDYKNSKLAVVCENTGKSKFANGKSKTTFDIKTRTYLGEHEVFDITVDADEHTYWTGGQLVSNCLKQTLESAELCNLVETFPANHDSYEDYERTLKFAYLYAKTVTLIPTHDARTNAVMLRNRRIGCSQSGIVQSFLKHGRRTHFQWCDKGYNYISKVDRKYSQWLCIPESIKKTSIKPSGSVSLLCGATPGMHYPESEYYIRNIRCEKDSKIAKIMELAGFTCEDDTYTPNTTVISIPVHEEYFVRGKADVSIWEQLEIAASLQQYWADNQVSATISFNESEAKDIKNALEIFETKLKGVSFLPLSGGGYKQAPYIPISKETYEVITSKLKPYDLSEITHDVVERFCDSDKCEIPLKK